MRSTAGATTLVVDGLIADELFGGAAGVGADTEAATCTEGQVGGMDRGF